MNIVILTGAGISVESGLSAFRGPQGLWEGRSIDEICTPDALARNPDLVCSFYDDLRATVERAEPNPAHQALALLEREWQEQAPGDFLLVTQNVDDLHEKAGSSRLLHMHGSLFTASCMECGWNGPRYRALEGERECPVCEQDALRPDIVLFGEAPRHMRRIEQAVQACDVFLAIGTSDTVYPAAGLVEIAVEAGAQTHQLNIERTVGSHRYGACHIGPATTLVPAWVDALLANRLT